MRSSEIAELSGLPDSDIMTIPLPSLPAALEAGLRAKEDTWGDDHIHISDLPVAIGEKCPRQLWLRLQGAEKKEATVGKLLMFDHGHRIHDRLVQLIGPFLKDGWKIESANKKVYLPCDVVGEYDVRLWHSREGWEIIVDFKTMRGRAFGYLTEAKPSNVLQVQGYLMAADADMGALLYVDREGSNAPQQFPVMRDDWKVEWAIDKTVEVFEQLKQSTVPPAIQWPKLKVNKNKGPDSVKLEMPWFCDYCDYCDVSCNGALPKNLRGLDIVGYVDDDLFTAKKDCPKQATEIVNSLLEVF